VVGNPTSSPNHEGCLGCRTGRPSLLVTTVTSSRVPEETTKGSANVDTPSHIPPAPVGFGLGFRRYARNHTRALHSQTDSPTHRQTAPVFAQTLNPALVSRSPLEQSPCLQHAAPVFGGWHVQPYSGSCSPPLMHLHSPSPVHKAYPGKQGLEFR